jgi:hypothetical protein
MILNNLQGKVFMGNQEVSQIYHGTVPLWIGTVEVSFTTKINIWFDNSGSMDSTLDDLQRMQANNLKTTLLPFYNNDGYENSIYLGGADMLAAASQDPPTNVINIMFQDEDSSPGTSNSVARAFLKNGLNSNIKNAAIFNRVSNGKSSGTRFRNSLTSLRSTGGVFASQCDYNLDVTKNAGRAYYAGLIETSLLRLGLEKAE